MSGPYDQSGLSEGFINGYQLSLQAQKQKADQAYQQHSMTLQDQNAQREQQLADSTTAYQSGQLGIAQDANLRANTAADWENSPQQRQLKTAVLNAQIAGEQAKSKAELSQAATAAQEAGAHGAYYNSETAKNTAALHDQQLLQDLTTTRERLSNVGDLNDPNFQQTAMNLDAFAHGQTQSIQNPQGVYSLLSKQPEFQKGIGQPIDPAHAADYGIPTGSIMVSNNIIGADINPQTNDTVFKVSPTYKTPDGRIVSIPSMPHVNSDDNVVVVPQVRMQNLAQGLGTTALMAKKMNAQGADANSMMNDIDAQIDGIVAKDPSKYIKTRNGYISNLETGDTTVPRSDQRAGIALMNNITKIQNNPTMSDSDKQKAISNLKQQYGQMGLAGSSDDSTPQVTPPAAASSTSGWSISPAK